MNIDFDWLFNCNEAEFKLWFETLTPVQQAEVTDLLLNKNNLLLTEIDDILTTEDGKPIELE